MDSLLESYFSRSMLILVEGEARKSLSQNELKKVMAHHGFSERAAKGHYMYSHPTGATVTVGDQKGKDIGPGLVAKVARHVSNELGDDDYMHPDNFDPDRLSKVKPGQKAYKSPFNPKKQKVPKGFPKTEPKGGRAPGRAKTFRSFGAEERKRLEGVYHAHKDLSDKLKANALKTPDPNDRNRLGLLRQSSRLFRKAQKAAAVVRHRL